MATDLLSDIKEKNFSGIYAKVQSMTKQQSMRDAIMRERYYEGTHYLYNGQEKRNDPLVNQAGMMVTTASGEFLYKAEGDEVRMDIMANYCREAIDTITEHCIGISEDDMTVIVDEEVDDKKKEIISSFFDESDIEEQASCVFDDFTKHPRAVIRIRMREESEKAQYSSPYYFEAQEYESFYPVLDAGGTMRAALVAYYVDTTKLNEYYDFGLQTYAKKSQLLYIECWTDEDYFVMIEDKPQEFEGSTGVVNENRLKFIPFFYQDVGRTDSCDMDNIISIQDAINKSLSSNDFIESLSSFGLLALDGDLNPEMMKAIQEAWGSGQLKLKPRTLLTANVKQLAASGIPDTSLTSLENLKRDLATTIGIPPSILLGDENSESGRSRKIKYTKLIAKCSKRRRKFNTLIEKMMRKIAPILIQEQYSEGMIKIGYPPIIEEDERDKVELAVMKQALGVSTPTLLVELGYDFLKEIEKRVQYDDAVMGSGINAVEQEKAAMDASMSADVNSKEGQAQDKQTKDNVTKEITPTKE